MRNNVWLITGNAIKLPIPDNSVDLIITHPPYLGIDAERYSRLNSKDQINFSRDKKKMLKAMNLVNKEMYRVLKPSGSLWIANGKNENFDSEYVVSTVNNTDFMYLDFVVQNGFTPDQSEQSIATQNITTWHHFSKRKDIYHNPYEVQRHSNPVWNIRSTNTDSEVDKELSKKYFVEDVMNEKIPENLIKMFSKPGHIVLDPFGGSALVAAVASKLGRSAISNDISEDQTAAAKSRLSLMGIQYKEV